MKVFGTSFFFLACLLLAVVAANSSVDEFDEREEHELYLRTRALKKSKKSKQSKSSGGKGGGKGGSRPRPSNPRPPPRPVEEPPVMSMSMDPLPSFPIYDLRPPPCTADQYYYYYYTKSSKGSKKGSKKASKKFGYRDGCTPEKYYYKKGSKKYRRRPPPFDSEPSETIIEIASGTLDLSMLVTLVTSEEQRLVFDTLSGDGPFTVFAPLNSAFDDFFAEYDPNSISDDDLTEILTYHVVAGELTTSDLTDGVIVALSGDLIVVDVANRRMLSDTRMLAGASVILNGDANVVIADIMASNGVIHIIDAVLLPPIDPIALVAADAGMFTTLLELLAAADLFDLFNDPTSGPFTLFAPTDDAFAALGLTVEELTADKESLTAVLTYHVLEGITPSAELVKLTEVTTLQGSIITVDGTTLNGVSEIIDVDILAANGIIHVIDTVLMPTVDPGTNSGGDGNVVDAQTPPPTGAPTVFNGTQAPTVFDESLAPTVFDESLAPTVFGDEKTDNTTDATIDVGGDTGDNNTTDTVDTTQKINPDFNSTDGIADEPMVVDDTNTTAIDI